MLANIEDKNILLDMLAQLSPKKRLDYIINHPTPLQVVRAMPSTDLLLTIRDLGGESSLELVEMMHAEQVQELFDLEIWAHEELNVDKAGRYFSLLFAANPDTAVAQLHGLDIELIGFMFKMVSTIYDVTEGEEPEDFPDLYSTSPDGRFIVCFDGRQEFYGLAQSLHGFLEELYGRDMKFALQLLENVRFELSSDLQEESLKWRNNRLQDLGILPREERLEYFAPLSLAELKNVPKHVADFMPDALLPTRIFSADVHDGYPFLKHAVSHNSASVNETFFQGVTHAFINMHASWSGDFGDRDRLAETSAYIKFLIELGLFQACRGQMAHAPAIFASSQPKLLIRLGRSMILGMRRHLLLKAQGSSWFGPNFCHADSPLREVAQAIALPEPRYYEGLLASSKLTVRYFNNLGEINATMKAIVELIFRAEMVSKLGLSPDQDKTGLSHAAMLGRAMINGFLGNAAPLLPISPVEIDTIFGKNRIISADFTKFARNFMKEIADRIDQPAGEDAEELHQKAMNYCSAILIQIEQNWQLALG